jgi:hypothetical protein
MFSKHTQPLKTICWNFWFSAMQEEGHCCDCQTWDMDGRSEKVLGGNWGSPLQ